MVDPKYTQRLYDALTALLEAIAKGGQPLDDVFDEADDLLDEIDGIEYLAW